MKGNSLHQANIEQVRFSQ